jgi:heptosyltransferase-2
MSRIAIIKVGATGDVVRTSVLLELFENDDITWVTAKGNIDVLPYQSPVLRRVLAIEDIDKSGITSEDFDLVISLDDDIKCARLASSLKTKELFGAYASGDKVLYTDAASEWFDMGLSSRYGKQKADEIKWNNKCSYQEILLRMLGGIFNGEEYQIREDVKRDTASKIIGIEARAGARWPTKVWNQYDKLAERLRSEGHEVVFFEERPTFREYFQDIANTSLMIGGDTLGMHIALALDIPSVILFTCTSATEIYGYGRMKKIVSPFLKDAFYKTDYLPHALDSIPLDTVYEAVKKQLSRRR